MSIVLLCRLAAVAAIVGGILRMVDAFAFEFLSSDESEVLFLVTDLALMFAMIGTYALLNVKLGWVGLIGFVVALVGFVLMRSAGDYIDAYIRGALITAIGVVIFGIAVAFARELSVYGPVLWLVGLVAGLVAYWQESDWAFEFAGVAFGLGFVLLGVALFRRPAPA